MWSKVLSFFGTAKYWVYIVVASLVAFVLALLRFQKNKVARLQYEVLFLKARREIDQLAQKQQVAVGELAALRKQDADVNGQLLALEESLKEQTKTYMTAEEIAKKFREIGIGP